MPEGISSAASKGREEATVQKAKLLVWPFLKSHIDREVAVNGLAPALKALKHSTLEESQFPGSKTFNDRIRNRSREHLPGNQEGIVEGAGQIKATGFIQNSRPVEGALIVADG